MIETLALDAKRRLVIARVDGREAVLLVGGANDQVVCLMGEQAETAR